VSANDPFSLASCILGLKDCNKLLEEISDKAYNTARIRHDRDTVKKELLNIY
jgi:GH15 family glucan-1,4-alpha-glucosidase